MTALKENGTGVIAQTTDQINAFLYERKLQPHAVYVKLVGSTFITGEGKDYDIAVCLPGLHHDEIEELRFYFKNELSFDIGGSGAHWDKDFESLKSGEVNVLLYNDWDTFYSMLAASRLCRSLHDNGISMADKDLRVHIHRFVMGEATEEAVLAD